MAEDTNERAAAHRSLEQTLDAVNTSESYKQYLNLLPAEHSSGISRSPRGVSSDDTSDLFTFSPSVVENPNFQHENEAAGTTLYPDLNAEADGEAASLPTSESDPLKPDPNEELRQELIKTEEEINTLRQVLHAKESYASELRKKLGLTPLSQISQTFKAELNKVQSSNAYKKTSETLKSAGQSTASAISNLGSSMSQKLNEMKNSQAFKSFEEKVEGVSTTIMAKVSGTAGEDKETPEKAQEASETSPVTEQPHQAEQTPSSPPL